MYSKDPITLNYYIRTMYSQNPITLGPENHGTSKLWHVWTDERMDAGGQRLAYCNHAIM